MSRVVDETFNEVDQLRGRLSAVMVNFPDTVIRMRPAIDVLDELLTKPTQGTIMIAVEELIDLRNYFQAIFDRYEETHKQFQPVIELIDRLLGPAEPTH